MYICPYYVHVQHLRLTNVYGVLLSYAALPRNCDANYFDNLTFFDLESTTYYVLFKIP